MGSLPKGVGKEGEDHARSPRPGPCAPSRGKQSEISERLICRAEGVGLLGAEQTDWGARPPPGQTVPLGVHGHR